MSLVGFTYKNSKMVGSSALHVVGFYYIVFSFLVFDKLYKMNWKMNEQAQ